MKDDWKPLLDRLDGVIERLDRFMPPARREPDFKASNAFRWRKNARGGYLEAVLNPHTIRFSDLKDIDEQKRRLRDNTAQFVAARPANNVLLTGARGTGKSSLVKAALNEFAPKGLRLIEVDKRDLVDLPDIVDIVAPRRERFVIFCDDLSFEASDAGYKSLKVALDGSIAGSTDNILIYATSNRRHLMPEPMADNTGAMEIHPDEAISEKLSLSDRFGLTLGIAKFTQQTYLAIVDHYAARMNVAVAPDLLHAEAIQWSLDNGRRTGRTAQQFVSDLAGRLRLAGR